MSGCLCQAGDHTDRALHSYSYKIIHFKCSLSHSRQHWSYGGLTTSNTSNTSTTSTAHHIPDRSHFLSGTLYLVWFLLLVGNMYQLSNSFRLTNKRMAISDTFHCNKCDKRFSSFILLNKHRSTHKNIFPICSKEFGKIGNIETVHKHTRKYQCNLCDKRYTDSTPLRVHKEIHTADLSKKTLLCSQCQKSFYTPSSLKAHIRRVHNKTVVTCKICL